MCRVASLEKGSDPEASKSGAESAFQILGSKQGNSPGMRRSLGVRHNVFGDTQFFASLATISLNSFFFAKKRENGPTG